MPRKSPAYISRLAAWSLLLVLLMLPACAAMQSLSDDASATRHYQQGLAYFAANDVAQAMAQFEMAVRKDAGMYQAYYYLGLTYKHLELPGRAKETWLTGLKIARASHDRADYPKMRAIAEMEAGLSSLAPLPGQQQQAGMPPGARRITPDMDQRKKAAQGGRKMKALPPAVAGPFAVLFSSNRIQANALKDQRRLQSWGFNAKLQPLRDRRGGTWHRVVINCCTDRVGAQATIKRLRAKGVTRKLLVVKAAK